MNFFQIKTAVQHVANKFINNRDGVTSIEYAIVAAGVAAVVLVIFANNGPVADMLTSVFNTLETTMTDMISSTNTSGGTGTE